MSLLKKRKEKSKQSTEGKGNSVNEERSGVDAVEQDDSQSKKRKNKPTTSRDNFAQKNVARSTSFDKSPVKNDKKKFFKGKKKSKVSS